MALGGPRNHPRPALGTGRAQWDLSQIKGQHCYFSCDWESCLFTAQKLSGDKHFSSHLALSRQSLINLRVPLRNGEGPPHFHLSAGKARGPFVPASAQPFSDGPGLVPTPLLNLVLIRIFSLLKCVVLTSWVGI